MPRVLIIFLSCTLITTSILLPRVDGAQEEANAADECHATKNAGDGKCTNGDDVADGRNDKKVVGANTEPARLNEPKSSTSTDEDSPQTKEDLVPPSLYSEKLTQVRKHVLASLENGAHYFSDYDISKVEVQPEPLLDAKHPKYYFHYMNQSTSKWPFAWVSNKPRIAFVPEFITEEEADEVIALAEQQFDRSPIAVGNTPAGAGAIHHTSRTSSGTWLEQDKHAISKKLTARALALLGFPNDKNSAAAAAEVLQVLRYEKGQKYDHHWDYFHPSIYGPQASNRAVTVYFYLSDVEEGGETAFPMADGNETPLRYYDVDQWEVCWRGFRTRPLKRSVAIFYSMTPTGVFDPASVHGSCPMKKGVKYGAPLWLRIPFGGTDD